MTDTPTTDATTRSSPVDEVQMTIHWLEDQFPGWTVDVDQTDTGVGELRRLWVASREGHHPQAELTAAKLHTRLTDYLDREERRRALMN